MRDFAVCMDLLDRVARLKADTQDAKVQAAKALSFCALDLCFQLKV